MPATPESFFAGSALGFAVFERLRGILHDFGPFDVQVTKSQLAFRRARGFAFLWRPDQYLRHPAAEVVLSIALDHEVPSGRFKQVLSPAPGHWMHHLELHSVDDVDEEVARWLRAAFAQADGAMHSGAGDPVAP